MSTAGSGGRQHEHHSSRQPVLVLSTASRTFTPGGAGADGVGGIPPADAEADAACESAACESATCGGSFG